MKKIFYFNFIILLLSYCVIFCVPDKMPGLTDTSWIISPNSPAMTTTSIVSPTIPGTLTPSRKDQEYGAEGTGGPR